MSNIDDPNGAVRDLVFGMVRSLVFN